MVDWERGKLEQELRDTRKMAQFHEGQEVEALRHEPATKRRGAFDQWRKAKIIRNDKVSYCGCTICNGGWEVKFLDGTRAVFDAEHIRAIVPKHDLAAQIKALGQDSLLG
jgi:hypothetical protein